MPAKREPSPAETGLRPDFAARVMIVLAWLVTAAAVIVPLAVAPDLLDRFRMIKEGVSRTEGIVGLFLIVVATAFGSAARLKEMARERAIVAILAAGLAWTVITTATSAHRLWSLDSLASVVTSLLVFVSVWYAAPRLSLTLLDLLVPGVLINTALAALQEYRIYQPFAVDPLTEHHLTATALIGNPNIVGSFMTLAAITFVPAAIRIQGWRRWWYAFGATCAVSGVFVSRTRTAVIALVVGLAVLAITLSVKRAFLFTAALVVLLGTGYLVGVGAIRRVASLPSRVAHAGWEVASSGRLTPALVSLAMFRDHPVLGVGPGAFRFDYMPYQVRARARYGSMLRGAGATSFGEAHNDHLQLLAETGAPGYALFLCALVALVHATRRAPPENERQELMRAIGLPLAVTLLVLCLAQFPLHVAATRQLLMTIAGVAVGWSRR